MITSQVGLNSSHIQERLIGQSVNEWGGEDARAELAADGGGIFFYHNGKGLREASVETLVSIMSNMFSSLSGGFFGEYPEMRTGAAQFVDRFKENKSGIYENEIITRNANQSAEMKRIAKNFGIQFHEALKNANGDISNVTNIRINDRPNFTNPYFGLGVTVHGTQFLRVYLTDFKIDPTSGKYSAKFRMETYDDFGLSVEDVMNYQNDWRHPSHAEGFVAWWILQHRWGFEPFTTKIASQLSFSGSIK